MLPEYPLGAILLPLALALALALAVRCSPAPTPSETTAGATAAGSAGGTSATRVGAVDTVQLGGPATGAVTLSADAGEYPPADPALFQEETGQSDRRGGRECCLRRPAGVRTTRRRARGRTSGRARQAGAQCAVPHARPCVAQLDSTTLRTMPARVAHGADASRDKVNGVRPQFALSAYST
jgi:hypothetical protein